jgi:hypothetical protein
MKIALKGANAFAMVCFLWLLTRFLDTTPLRFFFDMGFGTKFFSSFF